MKDISKRMIVISIVFCLLFSNFATLISFAVEEIPFEVDQTLNSNESENTNEEIDEELIQTDEALEIKEEGIEPELEFLRAYKTLNGVFVKAKFYESTQNILENLDNAKVQIKAPTIEGYNLINTYVESVELNDDTSEFYTTVENNDVIIDIVRKVEEDVVEEISEEETIETQETTIENVSEEIVSEEIVTNESETEIPIQDEVSEEPESEEVVAEEQEEVKVYDDEVLQLQSESSENVFEVMETPGLQALFGNIGQGTSNLQNTNHEYVILYEFEGTSETAVFNVEMRETLNYTDKDPKELAVIMEKEIPLTERDSNEYNLSAENQSLYKGYLYANSITDLKYETKYTCINNIKINSLENIDNIVITDTVDKLFTNGNQEIDMSKYVSYKKSSVKVEEFNNIFGEDGYIEIFKNGKSLGRIDKTSKVENDKYVFEYPEISSNVEFSFNNIKNTGTIDILNNKSISGTADFTRADVINFDRIESESIVQEFAKEQDTLIKLSEVSNKISVNLEDTESKMELSLNTNDLSTDISNDVMITVTLKTNQEKYELFKNPTIEVEFPYTVEDVNIKNINLIYKNGLSLDTYKVEAKESGEKVIKVSLAGTQEEYAPGTMLEGTQLVIYANVKLNRLVPNGSSNLKLRYTNEVGSKIAYEAIGNESETCNINYVSRSGLLTASTFENYNNNLDSVFNFENELNVGALDVQSDEKTAKMSMTVLNNYDTEISNVEIIGRIPAIGNTDKDGNDLHTTIDTYLKREITLSGLVSKIYYSTDITATRDSDSWQENIEDITKAKSYKIVIENETMKKGETISFDYDLVIPENLDFNQKIYGVFSVYYNLNGETIVEDSIIGAETQFKELKLEDYQTQEVISDVSLGIGTQVTLAGQVIDEETEVNEGQILRYNIIVANNGTQTINNIKLNGSVVNGNIYYQNKYEVLSTTTGEKATTYDWVEDTDGKHLIEEMTIDELKPGEVRTLSYQIVTKNPESEVYGEIEVSADEIESQKLSTIKNKVKDADLKMFVTTGIYEDIEAENLTSNSLYRIKTQLENISNKDLENINLEIEIPNFVDIDNELTEIIYDLKTNTIESGNKKIVNIYIDKLSIGEKKDICCVVDINDIDFNKSNEKMTIKAKTVIDNKEYISNEYTRIIKQTKTKFSAEYITNRENGSKVYNDDEILYKLNITNLGVINGVANVVDFLPYGLEIIDAKLTHGDGFVENISIIDKYLAESFSIKPEESVNLEINTKVNINDCRTGQEYISNIFEIKNDYVDGEIKEYTFEIGYPEDYFKDDEDDEKYEEYENDKINNNENEKIIEETLEDEFNSVPENNEEQFSKNNDISNDNSKIEEDTEKDIQKTEEKESDSKKINNIISNTTNNEINNNSRTNNISNTISNTNIQKDTTRISSGVNKKYSITGFVWYDEDKNGLYNNETKAENIKVSLYEYTTSDIKEKNLKTTVTTDKEGTYKFENIEVGKYIIIFEYDNNLYSVSDYAVSTGSAINKSYVTEKSVKIDEKEKLIGVSDIITLSKNISNINMGLISKNEFDMEITTYLESATIVNKKENKTEKFDIDSKLNKIEIASKYIDETQITTRYKIKVTNKGNISGYINQIEDKIPNGFEFDENKNNGWKLGNDGIVYNSSLSNTEIKPGEIKELTLVLTKNMTGNDTGTYKNEAKISNLTNNLKLKDKNEENNISSVELIIAIKTGVALYISIILFITSICLLIMYIVDKKILKNKIFKRTNFITILILGIILLGNITVVNANVKSFYLFNSDINEYYGYALRVNDIFKYYENWNYIKTWMCIEGNNIDNNGINGTGWEGVSHTQDRKIISWADFNKSSNSYKTYNCRNGNDSNNLYAVYFAYIGYAAENSKYGDNSWGSYKKAIGDLLCHDLVKTNSYNHSDPATGLKTMLGLSDLAGSNDADERARNLLDNHNILDDATKVYKFFNSNSGNDKSISVDQISNKKLETKIINNEEYIGPFQAKFAYISDDNNKNFINNSNILYYKVNGSNDFSKLSNVDLVNSSGSVIGKTNGNGIINNDLSNKAFYIKKSKEYTDFKLVNKHYSYRGRIVIAAGLGGGQIAASLRGTQREDSSSCTWTYDENYKVTLNKFLYSAGDTTFSGRENYSESQKSNDLKYAEINDEVLFRIDLKNNGHIVNYLEILDNFDGNILQPVGIKIRNYDENEFRYTNFENNIAVSGNKRVKKDSSGNIVYDSGGKIIYETISNPEKLWTATLSNNKISLKYEGTINKNKSASVYLKFKVKRAIQNDGYTTNKARVKLIKYNNDIIYKDKNTSVDNVTIEGTNKLENGSVLFSKDYLKVRKYSMVINKTLFSIQKGSSYNNGFANGNITYYYGDDHGNRENLNEQGKLGDIKYAEIGDDVLFRIDVANNGSFVNYFSIVDSFNKDKLELIGIKTRDYGGTTFSYSKFTEGRDGEKVIYTAESGKWRATLNSDKNKVVLKYDEDVDCGEDAAVYLKFRVKNIIANDGYTKNKVKLSTIKANDYIVKNSKTDDEAINKLDENSVLESEDYIKVEGYEVTLNKFLYGIGSTYFSGDRYTGSSDNDRASKTEDEKLSDIKYAEYGDEVLFRIDLKNQGSNIKKFEIKDTYYSNKLELTGIKIKDHDNIQFSFVNVPETEGIELKTGDKNSNGESISNPKYWTAKVSSVNDTSKKVELTYNGELSRNQTASIYLRYKIVGYTSNIDKETTNKAELTKIYNIYNNSVKDNLKSSSKTVSNEYLKIKRYIVNINKYITKVNETTIDGRNTNKNNTVYAEIGDKITYNIVIENKGTTDKYGSIKNIELSEIFDTNDLEFNSFSGTGWSKEGTNYTFSNSISCGGNSSVLSVVMVVKDRTELSGNITITNKVQISKVENQNSKDVNDKTSGNKSSTDSFKLLTYKVEIDKYISEINDSNDFISKIKDRKDSGIADKLENPVEVERNDIITYTIKVKNTDGTQLKNIKLKDELESGLEFLTTSLVSAKVYTRDGNEKAITVSETNVTQETIDDINYNVKYFETTGIIEESETLELKVKVKVTISNMYLFRLKNSINIHSIYNRNDINILSVLHYDRNSNEDYVRLKDLEIAGKVWIDSNKDGLINNSESGKEGIEVYLHELNSNADTNEDRVIKTTTTDNSGNYTFGRVDKATNKDANGNYTESSKYKQYYIEFIYNGIKYHSTLYKSNGRENLNSDGTYKENYKIDSNAAEFDSVRDAFNRELETIDYNRGIQGVDPSSSSTKNLEYKLIEEDDGHKHISELKDLDSIEMSAYSFVDKTKSITDGIDYLWLHKPGMPANVFNNYLQDTEYLKYINLGLAERKLDISVTKDLYEITTTVNGEQMTYDYNQNENAREKATGDTGNDNVFSVSNNKSVTADYLQQFSGKYITGGEEKPKSYEFEFYKSDYYYRYTDYIEDKVIQDYKTENSELNVELTYRIRVTNNNVENRENIYTIIRELVDNYTTDYKKSEGQTTIKLKDVNGLFVDKTFDNVEAWYYKENNERQKVNVAKNGIYGNINSTNINPRYNRVYLTGLDEVKLNEGESLDIFIKYVLDKDNSEDRKLKTGGKDTVVELNAYSTYNESNAPAGYVDMNSNPGNLANEDIDNTQSYENDTYKTQVNLKVSPESDDQDDLEDSEDPDPTPDPDPDPDPTPDSKERTITGFVWDDARTETVGNGNEKQYIGDGIFDTSKTKNTNAKSNARKDESDKLIIDETKDTPVEGATVELVELVNIQAKDDSGNLLYNDDGTPKMYTYEARIKPYRKSIQTTKTDSNGKYTINSFIPGKYIIMFHYGNTTDDEMILYNGQDYKSTTYKASIETGDSMNKIIQSLENANKSDARDDEIRRLEVISYSEKMNNEKTELLQQINLDDTAKTTLVNKTKMNAETPEFLIRPEKLDNYIEHLDDDKGYAELKYISYEDKIKQYNKDFRFILNNVDFGIQYRPEVKLELKKFISEVKAITSDGKTLLDAKFNLLHDGVGITGVELDEENSIGIEMLQYLATIINPDGTIADPGLQYINIDEEIMQGLNIQITYVFSANNLGEIDRIGKNLDALRFEKNDSGYNIYYDEEYTASGTAKNELFDEYYKDNVDIGEGKTATVRTQSKKAFSENKGYYGKYLGSLYYDGIISTVNDKIAEIKVDKILDYIDNNLTYRDKDNQGKDNYWSTTTPEELREKGLVTKDAFLDINEEGLPQSVTSLMDYKSIKYDTSDKHNLIVSVDDKTSETDSTHRNELLSKFIKPEENGQIFITASVIVSSETDTDKMSYYNAAEIVEYTTLTGRITNLNATIGNTIIKNFDPSDLTGTITKSNMDEIDTFYTARVTFTPPTGITIARYYTKLWSYQIKIIITGILAIIVVFIGYKNRNKIKVIKPKKFYK